MRPNTITKTTVQEISNPQIEFSVEDVHIRHGCRTHSTGCPIYLSMVDRLRELGIYDVDVSVGPFSVGVCSETHGEEVEEVQLPQNAVHFIRMFDYGMGKSCPFKFTLPMRPFYESRPHDS